MLRTGLAGAGLVAMALALAATPVTVRVSGGDGITVADSVAWAKRGGDDRGGDDRGGRGRGGDDRGRDDRGGRRGADDRGADDSRAARDRGRVVKVEQAGRSIEVTYANGVKEEIEAGRYERKNAAGDTIVERRATAADRARLAAIAERRGGGGGAAGGNGRVVKVEQQGRTIEVTYASGVKEEIEAGRYEKKNAAGRTIVERPATAADRARLRAIAAR